jgi:hypothetical protein
MMMPISFFFGEDKISDEDILNSHVLLLLLLYWREVAQHSGLGKILEPDQNWVLVVWYEVSSLHFLLPQFSDM